MVPPLRPLRIVHLAATAIGAPWMIAMLREQQRAGHEVAAILPSLDGSIAAELARDGIPCHAAAVDILFSISNPFAKALAIFRLVRLLRRIRPDVVHSHIVNSVITARIAAWIADVPLRYGWNAHPYSLESDVLRPLEVGTARYDTKTIASCAHTRELFLRHGVPEGQVELIYYAVDQRGHDPALADGMRVRTELEIPPDAQVVGKMAYFYPPAIGNPIIPSQWRNRGVKGHDVLLRAIPRVLASFPNTRFLLVGRGWGPDGPRYERELKELIHQLGIGDAVLLPGERADVPDTLAAFDVSVQCSLSDNLGGTVESLLMARPMVVSDIPGFAETVLHEQTGLVVPSDDPRALADAIVRLLGDRDLGRRLGENGRRHVLDRFTLQRTVADVEALQARSSARAEEHYRLLTTAARAVRAPFQLRPLLRELDRVCERNLGSRLRRLASRARAKVRRR